jgi:hypothetical protein
VLNVFRRSKNFQSQVDAIEAQSVCVNEILVWENGEDSIKDSRIDVHARSSSNLGVWARFTYALNASSDYVWVIDDDSIPGKRWLESAIHTQKLTGGLVGSRGLRFRTKSSYTLYDEFGPNNPSSEIHEVDIVGHNWFFPREWLGAFWSLYPDRFPGGLAGEDIHLSFAVQKVLGAGTFVPPHPIDDRTLWGEQPASEAEFGSDEAAISRNPRSMKKFEDAYAHYIGRGFAPMCTRDKEHQPGVSDRLAARMIAANPSFAQRLTQVIGLRK